jgi:putative methionine-R-sulfoxide reductase with GAF domain
MQMQKSEWERKVNELAALRKIVMAINSRIDDLDQVVHIILEKACELVSAAHGSLMLFNADTDSLRIAAVIGASWTPEKKACILRAGEGITGWVAATGQPYFCADTKNDKHYFPLFEGVSSELAVPVISQGKILGVINLDSERLSAFALADLELMGMLADHAAMAIENARQHALNRLARDRWIRVFDALPTAVALLDCDFVVERTNDRFLKFFGLLVENVDGYSVNEVLKQVPVPKPNETWKECLASGLPIQYYFQKDADSPYYTFRVIQVPREEKPLYLLSVCEGLFVGPGSNVPPEDGGIGWGL